MSQYIYSSSESVVLSLCKEVEYIKNRSKSINYSLKTCQNKLLSKRLRLELYKLNKSRLKILNISDSLLRTNCSELSFEFLSEITKRSGYFQQI